ncbi:GH39 family glycosyl hydrolase [Rudaeicoccus suwonensis]|uniref:Xylan 1,4-beta-xylosidase n=1 Tax=Rudaeicoccus suwonensis TaxID=657409 RepID=A0A561E830_9MICO|nr:xylan 1,4-beta-xylosidase [Rudaeicoccus suwonensis]TWE11720.1 xylan 1,4-beta-xylosidase [Rudaeicoccus suwonensis]
MTINEQDSATEPAADNDARTDWEQRIYRRTTDTAGVDPALELPAVTGVTAQGFVGHIKLAWSPVDGAAGYIIERTDRNGTAVILDHGGSDVPAVPGAEYADAGMPVGESFGYRIGAVAGNEFPVWHWSERVEAAVRQGPAEPVHVSVDAASDSGTLQRVWHLVGSERLSQLREKTDDFGNDIGAEFYDSLRIAHDELGVDRVRAHAVLDDTNAVVVRDDAGQITYDFTKVDAIYDDILRLGITPVVELGFMPAAIASDPEATVFTYRGIISPPTDWAEWRSLIKAFASHLVERYGLDEVAAWGFEVWNEPNLEVFWTGGPQDYLRLYDEAAAAIKEVSPRLLVGGPSTAASEWVHLLTEHVAHTGAPLDFISSHTYGNAPLDVQPAARRNGLADLPIWWTEWGVGHTHFGPLNDGVYGAPFVLTGLKSVQGRMDALAYWVVSDHFEELGRPTRLFHNGFGLLTVGNLRKPRFWATYLAEQMGDQLIRATVTGDGADVVVQTWASRHDDDTVDVLLWNSVPNALVAQGDPSLDRTISLDVAGLAAADYSAEVARVDQHHSNIVPVCPTDVDWPDTDLWQKLRAADVLDTEIVAVEATATGIHLDLALPMPGVARIRLQPKAAGAPRKEAS